VGPIIYNRGEQTPKIKLEKVSQPKALTETSNYKTNAIKVGKTLKQAGGVQTAVSSIIDYLT
jgi:hypothetical protein